MVKVGLEPGAYELKSTMILDPYVVKLFKRRWYALVKFPEPAQHGSTIAILMDMGYTDIFEARINRLSSEAYP